MFAPRIIRTAIYKVYMVIHLYRSKLSVVIVVGPDFKESNAMSMNILIHDGK